MNTTTERYWHGGAPGLKAGDILLPDHHLDTRHLPKNCPTCEREEGDAIFVSTSRDYSRVYAAGWPQGALYRVEPLGDLEPFDDSGERTYACGSARILAVYDPVVALSPTEVRRAVKKWGKSLV